MQSKIGQVAIFIVVALVLVGGIVLVSWVNDKDDVEIEVRECESADDCVPAECCNARLCVSEQDAPDCTGVMCPPGCRGYVTEELGCDIDGDGKGTGECVCVNQKCEASFY
ncbi:MAG: hypothetical protein KJ718_03445 [Nanoarchaeota archaeon]|nr:hypothetical protein [Nanoarchaeota archaeon]MBU1051584.1 hypothetical protein [Nanoarchaeota archaeon]MBU1988708.1 hypothetical protein [Nanoarchaeota archaeon]